MDSPSTPESGLILINIQQEWALKDPQRSCGWLVEWSCKNMSRNIPVNCLFHLPCEIVTPFLNKEIMVNPSELRKQKTGER